MKVRYVTEPAPGRVNEDNAVHAGPMVAVFDGVSTIDGLDTGCIHGTAWYVRQLARRLIESAADQPAASLSDQLAAAITATRGDHEGHCDLSHPGTPAAAVGLLREHQDQAEYLILCDTPIVLEHGDLVDVVTDERFGRAVAGIRDQALAGPAAIGTAAHHARVMHARTRQYEHANRAGGYWIAAADPEAAHQAVTGNVPLSGPTRLRRAALLTDGASCAVDQYHLFDWPGLLDLLTDHGPDELIRRVRQVENADRDGHDQPRYKRHDDATAALCEFEEQP